MCLRIGAYACERGSVRALASVAGGIRDRVPVLCLWRLAERGNRGAARELEGAARELGRVELLRCSRIAASPLTHAGFARVFSRPALNPPTRLPPNSFAARSNSLAAPRFPLSAIRHKQSTRTRSRIPPATQAISLAAAPLADRGFAAHARGLCLRFFSPRAKPANSTPPQFPRRYRGSLSLPFAINKARALGRESRQLRRLLITEMQVCV